MAFSTIDKSSLYQNTVLYEGTGSSNAITGVGFQPDLTWVKDRDATNWNCVMDSVRGASKVLYSNENDAEATVATLLTSFDSDGFTLGTSGDGNSNTNGFASWNWKAGTTGSGSTSGSGSAKTYSYSKNLTSGFSIIKYVGNGTAGHTIPHELAAVPDLILVKNLDAGSTEWRNLYPNVAVGNTPNNAHYNLNLNSTNTWNNGTEFNDTMPTTTVFSVNGGDTNTNDVNYIAYCWKNIPGYSKINFYVGNGQNAGPFVWTGFRPTFIMIKNSAEQRDWYNFDYRRDGMNSSDASYANRSLRPNTNATEATASGYLLDILSNGFKMRDNSNGINELDCQYIYMAFGQPIMSNSGICATAR